MPQAEFDLFAKNMGFTTKYSESLHHLHKSTINVRFSTEPIWWKTQEMDSDAYLQFTPSEDRLEYARYVDGKLFYLKSKW